MALPSLGSQVRTGPLMPVKAGVAHIFAFDIDIESACKMDRRRPHRGPPQRKLVTTSALMARSAAMAEPGYERTKVS
jgi:hypothetical protein